MRARNVLRDLIHQVLCTAGRTAAGCMGGLSLCWAEVGRGGGRCLAGCVSGGGVGECTGPDSRLFCGQKPEDTKTKGQRIVFGRAGRVE